MGHEGPVYFWHGSLPGLERRANDALVRRRLSAAPAPPQRLFPLRNWSTGVWLFGGGGPEWDLEGGGGSARLCENAHGGVDPLPRKEKVDLGLAPLHIRGGGVVWEVGGFGSPA